jgi:hypothetical protein
MTMSIKLTLTEAMRLRECEKGIEKGKTEFIRVGLLLEEIKSKRLYRARYGTFEEYCTKRWNMGRSYGYALIEDAKVAVKMSTIADIPDRATAHAITKVEPAKRAAVVQRAAASGPVTAASVAKAAKEPKPDIVLDETGYPIPPKCLPFWNRREDVQDCLQRISGLKTVLRQAQETNDPMYNPTSITISAALADLDKVYTAFKNVKPYAVCSSCQGKTQDRCQLCGGTGLVSKFKHDFVPEKIKVLRK